MNYLAHAYLSFNQPDILLGNIISDFVKGKKQFDYSPAIQKGIRLHRAIDLFTDSHSSTKLAQQYLKPAVGAYSGAFIDIAFDHFLALDKSIFKLDDSLANFAKDTYAILETYEYCFPEGFKIRFPSMKHHNWLFNYQYKEGIENSFASLARRAAYLSTSEECFQLFENHYIAINNCYKSFFPELKEYVIDLIKSDNH